MHIHSSDAHFVIPGPALGRPGLSACVVPATPAAGATTAAETTVAGGSQPQEPPPPGPANR